MPRPGPRPYECVRRAWHSDRHQPIRGSLVQEIFRLAIAVHNPRTRKNEEWLEKLPLVVFKAEEIMYSKANSEAEYMDLNTLWERANDAIDTIIRKDDAPETEGDLLQPCIEAALNLGCIPRRASRSQRHNNPEYYLSSTNKEGHHLGSSIHLLPRSSLSRFETWYSTFVTANKLNHFGSEVHSVVPNGSFEPKDPISPLVDSLPTYNCLSMGHLHPLYYGNVQHQYLARGTIPDAIHRLPSVCGKEMSFLHNFIGNDKANGALHMSSIFGLASKDPRESECDLSLRLGLFSSPSLDEEMVSRHEVEDVGSSSTCSGSRCSNQTGGLNSENFIPLDINDEPLECCSSKRSSKEEGNAMLLGF